MTLILHKGKDQETIDRNIRTMMQHGYSKEAAISSAFSMAKKKRPKHLSSYQIPELKDASHAQAGSRR